MPQPRSSGYFRTTYSQDMSLLQTRGQRGATIAGLLIAGAFPFVASPFMLDLGNQVLIAVVGAVALMLLTGYAGQVSLGHAGLMAAGAFTTGILARETGAPFWITLPAAGLMGAVIGFVFGLPSLRLRGLYLAVSTLALHFIVIHAGQEYETRRGLSSGVVIEPPSIAGVELFDPRAWYAVLLVCAGATVIFALNLLRSRTGRAWRALHGREPVAEALGIPVAQVKVSAFVVASTLTALSGSLFAYYRGFVSSEAFSLFLTIQYVAMIIIGGMGSILGAVLGAAFVTLFPYLIESMMGLIPGGDSMSSIIFAVNYAAFGLVMIVFLLFEPQGLVGIWRRVRNWFLLWPFRQKPLR
mgnify:CR=1 FL=1